MWLQAALKNRLASHAGVDTSGRNAVDGFPGRAISLNQHHDGAVRRQKQHAMTPKLSIKLCGGAFSWRHLSPASNEPYHVDGHVGPPSRGRHRSFSAAADIIVMMISADISSLRHADAGDILQWP